jgi:hypothetical protein
MSTDPDPHLHNNPHVLFPDPLRCFANRKDWTVQTVFVGDTFAEFTLTLRGEEVPPSSDSSSARPPRPGPPAVRDAPTRVQRLYQSAWRRWLFTFIFAALSFVVWPPSSAPADPTPTPSSPPTSIADSASAVLLALVAPGPLALVPQRLLDAGLRLLFSLLLARLAVGGPRVVQQSIAATRGLGLQLTSVADDGSRQSTFLDASGLRGIVINEGLRRCGVEYYLAIVASGKKKLLLPFDHARPRLPVLAHIYRHLTHIMCDDLPVEAKTAAALAAAAGEEAGAGEGGVVRDTTPGVQRRRRKDA